MKFTYSNGNDDDWKCQYRVSVLDGAGKEIASENGRQPSTGTRKRDTNRVSVSLRTLDFPRAATLRVRVLARPD